MLHLLNDGTCLWEDLGVSYLLERAVGRSLWRIGERDAALKVRAVLSIRSSDVTSVIHEEENAASGAVQIGPATLQDRLLQSQPLLADVIRGDDLLRGEYGADLGIDVVEEALVPLDDFSTNDGGKVLGRRVLEEDGDRDAVGVGIEPLLDDLQAGDESVAG